MTRPGTEPWSPGLFANIHYTWNQTTVNVQITYVKLNYYIAKFGTNQVCANKINYIE